jgi:predicted nucleic acid-binding protein
MKVFVDTAYWVARLNQDDQWHQQAKQLELQVKTSNLITAELVLVEFLNYFSSFGAKTRDNVSNVVQAISAGSNVQIVWQTQALFEAGLALYKARLDKGYSLTDCVSMVVMRQEGIQEILTHDRHFAQEGFTLLL